MEQTFDKLILEGRKRLTITGVSSVEGFSDKYIKLVVNGSKAIVSGNNIKITGYNKGTGTLTADGEFTLINYAKDNGPMLKRLFK